MKKIIFSLLICSTALLFYSEASAQNSLDLSNFKMTPDIVRTATLNDGLKASFCPVDLGITGKELLASDVRDANFKLPNNIQSAPCKGSPEDIIFAMVNVEFTKPVQEQNSVGLFFVLFRDRLFQQNGHPTIYGSAYYPNPPQTFSYKFLNGGEEGNTPPYGNPKWLKYEKDGDFLEMDPSSKEGFKTNPDSGYILYFDSEGNRKEFLFVFEGKIYKLVKAEKKNYNTVVLDYSQNTPQNTGSSTNTTTPAGSTPSTTTNSSVKTSDVIIISENMTWAGYPNQSIHFNITMPRAGGDISGYFSGLCNGSINGYYNGGEGSINARYEGGKSNFMLGRAWGSCDIPFLDHAVDISYTGTVFPQEGKMNIDWLSHSGVTGERSESFTQNFIPQQPSLNNESSTDTASHSNTSSVVTISNELTYMNLKTNYSITMPKAGGNISGTFSGVCNGSMNGQYSGGEGGSIQGKVTGDCNILFLHQALDITYSGNIWPSQGKANIDWESQTGIIGNNKGSFTQNFIPQP